MQAIKNTRAEYRNTDALVKHMGADKSARDCMTSELGLKIRAERRSSSDMPMAEFAAELGVSERALSNYELGKRLPEIDFLARFATATGADLNELIRLRLGAGGFEQMASQIQEARAMYMAGGEGRATPEPAAHARRVLLSEKDLDPAWSLAIMELASRGQITPDGIDRLLDFLREWSLSDDRAWEWIEEHLEEVAEKIDEDRAGDDHAYLARKDV